MRSGSSIDMLSPVRMIPILNGQFSGTLRSDMPELGFTHMSVNLKVCSMASPMTLLVTESTSSTRIVLRTISQLQDATGWREPLAMVKPRRVEMRLPSAQALPSLAARSSGSSPNTLMPDCTPDMRRLYQRRTSTWDHHNVQLVSTRLCHLLQELQTGCALT